MQQIENGVRHIDVGCLRAATHVIYLAQPAFLNHRINPRAMIQHVLIITLL